MVQLEEVIRREIDSGGAISFARFMQLALYHPQHGYYQRHARQTGREGDFFTNVSVGSLYGELLGFDFTRRLQRMTSGPWELIEAGAHDGQLAHDLLTYLRDFQKEIFRQVTYVIIEPSAALAQKQFHTLGAFHGKVRWVRSWSEIESFRGICFSNELLDAMPVHVFRWDSATQDWREWGVTAAQAQFGWSLLPPEKQNANARKLLARLDPDLTSVLPDLFTVEISPEAVSWWLSASHSLSEGWLFTADYGFLQEEFFSPQRSRGTLRAYSRHHSNGQVLQQVGEQDITAHVNFSLLMAAGESAGLAMTGFLPQEFFLKTVLQQIEQAPAEFPLWTPIRYRQLMSLMHPEHLGRAFKVLLQNRATPKIDTSGGER